MKHGIERRLALLEAHNPPPRRLDLSQVPTDVLSQAYEVMEGHGWSSFATSFPATLDKERCNRDLVAACPTLMDTIRAHRSKV